MDTLGNASYFTLLARWPGEIRLFTVEGPMLQTEAEVIEALEQNERAVLVYRHDPDAPRRDVSEDIARRWVSELETGIDGLPDYLPAFIRAHVPENALETAE